jgi:DNA-directed RNA polymerase subunit RPC12/RpoP
MKKQSKTSLREKATRVWQKVCAKRSLWADELRQELKDVFGASYAVEIEWSGAGRPVAKVEGLRFILNRHSEDGVKTFQHLMLLSNCAQCGREIGTDIDDLADLGRWLEILEKIPDVVCSRCMGLPRRQNATIL